MKFIVLIVFIAFIIYLLALLFSFAKDRQKTWSKIAEFFRRLKDGEFGFGALYIQQIVLLLIAGGFWRFFKFNPVNIGVCLIVVAYHIMAFVGWKKRVKSHPMALAKISAFFIIFTLPNIVCFSAGAFLLLSMGGVVPVGF